MARSVSKYSKDLVTPTAPSSILTATSITPGKLEPVLPDATRPYHLYSATYSIRIITNLIWITDALKSVSQRIYIVVIRDVLIDAWNIVIFRTYHWHPWRCFAPEFGCFWGSCDWMVHSVFFFFIVNDFGNKLEWFFKFNSHRPLILLIPFCFHKFNDYNFSVKYFLPFKE